MLSLKMHWRRLFNFCLNNFFVLVLFLCASYLNGVEGFGYEEIADLSKVCCNRGVEFASEHADSLKPGCSASLPPDDVQPDMGLLCNLTMDQCCRQAYKESAECEVGKKLAASKECSKPTTDIGKNCCDECSLGKLIGASQGRAGCKQDEPADEEVKNSASLRKKAFHQCCTEAAEKSDLKNDKTDDNVGAETTDELNNNQTPAGKQVSETPDTQNFLDSKESICELFAPDELCAHHCIPVPGSYRCECNPGFILMADGKSCRKNDNDRCKTKNPCQQKCSDNGVTVNCSCRFGYELMDDKKSCIDINECSLGTSTCREGTLCHNTEGAYKCIPEKTQLKKKQAEEEPDFLTQEGRGGCPRGYVKNRLTNVCDDINECTLKRSPCPYNYTCVNRIGSFTCKESEVQGEGDTAVEEDICPNGYRRGKVEECEDIDECKEGTDDCNKQSQICLNTNGGFTCQNRASKTNCPPGFMINKLTSTCEDIDECVENSELCSSDTVCVNEPGGYNCKPKTNSSPPLQRPETRLTQIDCAEGFRPAEGSCEDVNECAENLHDCDEFQQCINTFGGHSCSCKIGFKLDPITKACVDINECQHEDRNTCVAESQRCDNTVGSYQCVRFSSCGTGYTLHASTGTCEDDDECVLGIDNCLSAGQNFQCVNVPGTFRCVRKRVPTSSTTSTATPDFFYDDTEYYDENETEPATTSQPVQEVAIKPPQRTTTPRPPTVSEPPKVVLAKAPLRAVELHGVPNEDGSVSINTNDLPKNTWTTIYGKGRPPVETLPPEKHCIAGYVMNARGDCIDIDECAESNHACKGYSEVCINDIGSYSCICADGYTRRDDSNLCLLITTTPPPQTSTPTTTTSTTIATSTSTKRVPFYLYPKQRAQYTPQRRLPPFRPTTLCDAGYHHNSSTGECQDINECESGIAKCAAVEICVNTQGGYRCDCPPGWSLDQNRHRCLPIHNAGQPNFRSGYENEEVEEPPERIPSAGQETSTYPSKTVVIGTRYGSKGGGYSHKPFTRKLPDNSGMYTSCHLGYQLTDDGRCIDIDECTTSTHTCGEGQYCTNKAGGYICGCPPGHRYIKAENKCEDIDECQLSNGRFCQAVSDCVNTIGSYKCTCHTGFRSSLSNDRFCTDVDECEEQGASLCQHSCFNVWGTYRCGCHRGYRLDADNKTCSDVNECETFADRHVCVGICRNEPGSYHCECPTGYRLGADKRSCIDIDECEVGTATCAGNPEGLVCQNTRGGYKCHKLTCAPGYRPDPTSKKRCTKIQGLCPLGDWECERKPNTYSYTFITFVSNLFIPPPPRSQVDLFTMRSSSWRGAQLKFELKLISVHTPPGSANPATKDCFLMTPSANQAIVSLVRPLHGPQDIELELSMELYTDGNYGGTAVAKLIIFVSEYEY